MGITDFFKPKDKIPLLKQEDVLELRELERQAYLKEAKQIVASRGISKAKSDYGIKEKKQVDPWLQT